MANACSGFVASADASIFELEEGFFLVIHLMVAGRLYWKEANAKIPGRAGLAAFDFANGTLLLTEVSTKKRASIHVVHGEAALKQIDRGGLEVMTAHVEQLAAAEIREPHAQTITHRPAALLCHRKRVLRRDSASRQAVSREAVEVAHR